MQILNTLHWDQYDQIHTVKRQGRFCLKTINYVIKIIKNLECFQGTNKRIQKENSLMKIKEITMHVEDNKSNKEKTKIM